VRRVRRTTTVIATNPEEVLCRSPEYRGSDITGDQPVDERLSVGTPPAAAKAADIAGIGVYTLRHSAAWAWLESGTHIRAVADLLGHSSIAITGDVYGHTSQDTARAAVDGVAGRLGL
jgi:integrase